MMAWRRHALATVRRRATRTPRCAHDWYVIGWNNTRWTVDVQCTRCLEKETRQGTDPGEASERPINTGPDWYARWLERHGLPPLTDAERERLSGGAWTPRQGRP